MGIDPVRWAWRKAPPEFKAWYANRRFRRRYAGLDAELLRACLIQPSKLAFAIVHWNAPDYLKLNIQRLAKLYPDSRVYVLDNGSVHNYFYAASAAVAQFPNVEFWHAQGESEHAVGLQFLLKRSAMQGDRWLCFLDQDCLLISRIDPLLEYFNNGISLIGPEYFNFPQMIHSSLAILQPQIVWALYGDRAFEYLHTHTEPMFGISQRFAGKILRLEHRFNDPHQFISTYLHEGTPIAYHGWYSSRAFGKAGEDTLDGDKKVADVVAWRTKNYEFMREALK